MAEAGLALGVAGVVPLIVLAFEGYVHIHKWFTEFASLDRKLARLRIEIGATEALFKAEVKFILSRVVKEDRREIMLEDSKSLEWEDSTGALESQIRASLGDLYMPMVNLVQSANDIMKLIEDLFQKLGKMCGKQKNPKPREKASSNTWSRRMFDPSLSIVESGSRSPQVDNPSRPSTSTKFKLKVIGRNIPASLEYLLSELRKRNTDIAQVRMLHSWPSIVHISPPPPLQAARAPSHSTGGTIVEAPVRTFSPKQIQVASQKLYGILEDLSCPCHMLHLRLEKLSKEEISICSSLSSPIDPIKFSFLMTTENPNGGGSESMPECSLHLVFTGHDFQVTGGSQNLPPTPPPEKRYICEEALSDWKGYERLLVDKIDGNSGFLLKCASSLNAFSSDNSNFDVSLRDLIQSLAQKLTQYDKLRIAGNLAHSIIPFYRSPWIRNWSAKEILFFKRCERSETPASWTPHVAANFFSDENWLCGMGNTEIYALGLILLEIGRSKQLECSRADEDGTVKAALQDLVRYMGLGYKKVVQHCLHVGGNSGVDLMEGENLKTFLTDVNLIEELAKGYQP